MGENQKRLRYYLPELTNVLFASHFDSYHVRSLSTLVHDSMDYVLNSRDVGYLQPEVQLLTRVLYYIPTVLLFQATPGHVFSGIKPASYDEEEGARKGIRFPGLKRLMYLSLAYSVLPYVYERRDLIFRNIIDLYKLMLAKEDDIILLESINEIDNDEVNSWDSADNGYVSFWGVFKRAITVCYTQHIGVDNTTRLTRICNFLYDWHVMLFLVYHRYWEVPMRLCNLQLISTAKPVIQMKLDTLSWIAKFQSAFQVYYMMRILGHELDASTAYLNEKIRQPQEEKMDESHPSSVVDEISAGVASNNAEHVGRKKCPLCLDPMHRPAVIPCGHTFCWSCVFSFANKQQRSADTDDNDEGGDDSGRTAAAGCACPICRVEFTKYKIRALHAYI